MFRQTKVMFIQPSRSNEPDGYSLRTRIRGQILGSVGVEFHESASLADPGGDGAEVRFFVESGCGIFEGHDSHLICGSQMAAIDNDGISNDVEGTALGAFLGGFHERFRRLATDEPSRDYISRVDM